MRPGNRVADAGECRFPGMAVRRGVRVSSFVPERVP